MTLSLLLTTTNTASAASPAGYLIGLILSVLILGYLIYTLVKPEKF